MVIPSRFLPKLKSGSRSQSWAVCARSLPAGRANKLPARPRSATTVPRTLDLNTAGPSPRGDSQPPFPRSFLLPGKPCRSRGPQVWDGKGSGKLALRLPLSALASWAPEKPSLPFLGPPPPWGDFFRPRPLTPDPPSPKRLPRLVLKPLLCAKVRGSSKAPAGPGHAFATHRTPAWDEHARFMLVCVGVPGGPRNHSFQLPGARWSVGSRWTRTSERPAPFLRQWLHKSHLRKSTLLKSTGGYSWNLAIALPHDIRSTGLAGISKEKAGV